MIAFVFAFGGCATNKVVSSKESGPLYEVRLKRDGQDTEMYYTSFDKPSVSNDGSFCTFIDANTQKLVKIKLSQGLSVSILQK